MLKKLILISTIILAGCSCKAPITLEEHLHLVDHPITFKSTDGRNKMIVCEGEQSAELDFRTCHEIDKPTN